MSISKSQNIFSLNKEFLSHRALISYGNLSRKWVEQYLSRYYLKYWNTEYCFSRITKITNGISVIQDGDETYHVFINPFYPPETGGQAKLSFRKMREGKAVVVISASTF
jgi:hypothetical protein